MRNYRGRIEIKPGKFAYDQTPNARLAGLTLIQTLLRRWSPPPYCYHLKKGGHLTAVARHLGHRYFARLDIEDFFQSISKQMIVRALKKTRLSFRDAANAAAHSTVAMAGTYVLPYGFVQSPLLATLVLARSPVHPVILGHLRTGIMVTVYVDDILISADSLAEVQRAYDQISEALVAGRFRVNARKSIAPGSKTEAFNLAIEHRSVEVTPERMDRFHRTILHDPQSESAAQSIRYVSKVNANQGKTLAAIGGAAAGPVSTPSAATTSLV